jgi:hypothetical protein
VPDKPPLGWKLLRFSNSDHCKAAVCPTGPPKLRDPAPEATEPIPTGRGNRNSSTKQRSCFFLFAWDKLHRSQKG